MMTLVEEAELAEKIGNALTRFSGSLPESIQDINAAISALFGVSIALREIHGRIEADGGRNLKTIKNDLQDVHDCITFTLQDIWTSIGKTAVSTPSPWTPADFRRTWQEIVRQCRQTNGQSLKVVLGAYARFVQLLCKILRRRQLDLLEFQSLRGDVQDMRNRQDSRERLLTSLDTTQQQQPDLVSGIEALTIPDRSPTKQRSYERPRNSGRPLSPTDSHVSSEAARFRHDAPWAPSPPLSPAATYSSQVSSIPSVENNYTTPASGVPSHWAKTVFDNASATSLPLKNETTRYHERSGVPEQERPNASFECVHTTRFPEKVKVSLLCRAVDYRAKIVVDYTDYRGQREFACVPLERLQMRRKGALLMLVQKREDGQLVAWLSMTFPTIERLVLFASTFQAMRSQDGTTIKPLIEDNLLRDEVQEYAGRIRDHGYRHCLYVFRDRLSGAVRLLATVLYGELDGTPIWTAFITHQIMSKTWAKRTDHKKILYLTELRPHVFSSEYKPDLAPSGEYMLCFEVKDDAEDFLNQIEHLRRRQSRGGR